MRRSARKPGTIDFMRSKIKHVVYHMLENRSFDHVLGWLHDKDAKIHVVGPDGRLQGREQSMYNVDESGNKVFLSKYKDGKPSTDYAARDFQSIPYHDKSDVLRQISSTTADGYQRRRDAGHGRLRLEQRQPAGHADLHARASCRC